MSVGFEQSSADPWIYVQGDDCPIVVAAYVDDLIIATKTIEEMQQVKELLQYYINNDDGYGRVALLPGNHYRIHSWRPLELHQKQYIKKMLKKYKLEDVKPVSTPADPNVTLQKDDGISKAVNPVVYQ